jgi:hypothetical protein
MGQGEESRRSGYRRLTVPVSPKLRARMCDRQTRMERQIRAFLLKVADIPRVSVPALVPGLVRILNDKKARLLTSSGREWLFSRGTLRLILAIAWRLAR